MSEQEGRRGVYIVTARQWDGSGTVIIGCFERESEAHNIQSASAATGASMELKVISMPLNVVAAVQL
jgi:hypothetical protein